MEPRDLTYRICGCYIRDQYDVDQKLRSSILGMNRARDFKSLSSCTSHFDWHLHSVNEWRFLRQIEAFFKKNALFASPDECAEAAKLAFFENEQRCAATNSSLKDLIGSTKKGLPLKLLQQILQMERYVSTTLGDVTTFIAQLPELMKVTPGATAQSSRKDSLPQLKLKMRLFCTARAKKYLRALFRFHGFNEPLLKTTTSNRIELVPKNWKTDRTIACEPEGNLPLQLAFDTYAKRCLRKRGIDLSDQSANQKKAKHASIYNDYVTVDFSAASDTISYNTVALIIQPDWFRFLSDVRSPDYRGAFGDGTYHKFSSMGNGCTFTIETLLFAAACHAVGSRNFLVYGDDVIIERKYYEEFIALTSFLGFSINVDKSFSDGPFRESCGKDYFDGTDVTPVFIRSIDGRKVSLCHLVNTIGELTYPGSSLEKLLFNLIKEEKLPLVPWQESTLSGVWIDPQTARNLGVLRRRHGLDSFKAYVPKCRWRRFPDSRGYYLWFIMKKALLSYGGPWDGKSRADVTQTSSVPLFDHAYVRKRVAWSMPRQFWDNPSEGMPAHVVTWASSLPPLLKRPK